jgi:hypothetical protein
MTRQSSVCFEAARRAAQTSVGAAMRLPGQVYGVRRQAIGEIADQTGRGREMSRTGHPWDHASQDDHDGVWAGSLCGAN